MSPVFFFYLAGVIPSIGGFFIGSGVLLAFLSLAMGLKTDMDFAQDDNRDKGFKQAKKYFLTALVFFFVAAFLPSRKTIYLMGASEVVASIANNDRVQALAGNSLKLIENKVQKILYEDEKEEKK